MEFAPLLSHLSHPHRREPPFLTLPEDCERRKPANGMREGYTSKAGVFPGCYRIPAIRQLPCFACARDGHEQHRRSHLDAVGLGRHHQEAASGKFILLASFGHWADERNRGFQEPSTATYPPSHSFAPAPFPSTLRVWDLNGVWMEAQPEFMWGCAGELWFTASSKFAKLCRGELAYDSVSREGRSRQTTIRQDWRGRIGDLRAVGSLAGRFRAAVS